MDDQLGRASMRLKCCCLLGLDGLRLRPSCFDCLRWDWSNSHAWMAQGIRRLLFEPVGALSSPSRGGWSVTKHVATLFVHQGQSVGWTIRKVAHPTGLNRLVDNPQVERSTIHQICHVNNHFFALLIFFLDLVVTAWAPEPAFSCTQNKQYIIYINAEVENDKITQISIILYKNKPM